MRPRALAGVVAEIASAASKRLVRKLDASPDMASAWAWRDAGVVDTADGRERVEVETDRGEVVTLATKGGVLMSAGDVMCTCLLSPRCLHVLAVVHALELATEGSGSSEVADEDADDASDAGDSTKNAPTSVALSAAQIDAVASLRESATELANIGARNAGAIPQARALHAAHTARVHGLHRGAAAALRVVSLGRLLRASSEDFRAEDYLVALRELLWVCASLPREGGVSPAVIGKARRHYEPIGSLRLYGLYCEPVLTRTGYAGVRTVFMDDERRFYSLGDVMPGGAERILGAYGAGEFAGLARAHRELSRTGMRVSGATVSGDGRLGAGKGVSAVSAPAIGWREAPLAGLFDEPIADQIERERHRGPEDQSAPSPEAGLLFVRGEIAGLSSRGDGLVWVADAAPAIELRAARDTGELPYVENIRALECATGQPARAILRRRPGSARVADLLAISFDEAGRGASAELGRHINVGLDRLRRVDIPEAASSPRFAGAPTPGAGVSVAALDRLHARLLRAALGGRDAFPPGARRECLREAQKMRDAMLPTAAELLEAIVAAVDVSGRDLYGVGQQESAAFARALLEALVYERAAVAEVGRSVWG